VTTELAAFATQRTPPARRESGWFENTATYPRCLLKIGGVKAVAMPENVFLTGEASLQRRARIITKCWNLARICRICLECAAIFRHLR
jgi:hypothetical protein